MNVWGTITDLSPLRVRIAGDPSPLPITPKTLIDPQSLSVDDFVRCEFTRSGIVILGRADGVPPVVTRTVPYTTSSLADGATETVELDLGRGFVMAHFASSHAARSRCYQSSAHRAADASRPVGVSPSGDHGLIHEEDGTTGAESYATDATGVLLDGETLTPFSFQNTSGGTAVITFLITVRS